MKQLKILLLAVAFTASGVLFASNEDKKSDSAVITESIGKLLKSPSFLVDKDIIVSVTITLNRNNEIVVLSVDSKELYVENFIKSRLNYKKLPSTFYTKEKTFKVPVRVTAE
jgi:flagellar basal body-associated protein FliL